MAPSPAIAPYVPVRLRSRYRTDTLIPSGCCPSPEGGSRSSRYRRRRRTATCPSTTGRGTAHAHHPTKLHQIFFSHPLCPRVVCAASRRVGAARRGAVLSTASCCPKKHCAVVYNSGGCMQRSGTRAGMHTSSAAHRRSRSRESPSVAEDVDRVIQVVALGAPLVEGVGHLRRGVCAALVDPIAVVRVPLPDALVVVAAQVTHQPTVTHTQPRSLAAPGVAPRGAPEAGAPGYCTSYYTGAKHPAHRHRCSSAQMPTTAIGSTGRRGPAKHPARRHCCSSAQTPTQAKKPRAGLRARQHAAGSGTGATGVCTQPSRTWRGAG